MLAFSFIVSIVLFAVIATTAFAHGHGHGPHSKHYLIRRNHPSYWLDDILSNFDNILGRELDFGMTDPFCGGLSSSLFQSRRPSPERTPFSSLLTTDLIETEKEYRVLSDLPGVDPKNLALSIEEDDTILVIQAERISDFDDIAALSKQSSSCQTSEREKAKECKDQQEKDEQKKENKSPDRLLQSERCYGKVEKRIYLPKDVDIEKVQSKLVNGVLTILLPKRQDVPPARRQLKVDTA